MGHLILTGEQARIFEERRKLTEHYRGLIIGRATDIEFLMEMIISHYFCADIEKANELRHRLICDTRLVSFDSKWKILRALLHSNQFKTFSETYPKLITDIKYLIEIRNMVCHKKVLLNQDYLNKFDGETIEFENFEVEEKTYAIKKVGEPINKKVINEFLNRTAPAVLQLEELLNLIYPHSY